MLKLDEAYAHRGLKFLDSKILSNVEYCDIREGIYTNFDRGKPRITEVKPDRLTDFRCLLFEDNSFYQIIFDPPHLIHAGDNSWLKTKYGRINQENWKTDIRAGFSEAWRVLKLNGTLIFKWNDSHISIAKLKPFFPSQPIIGQKSPKSKNGKYTHW